MPKTKISTTSDSKKVGIRPLMGYLLVEPDKAEAKTASGLYLPETSQERPAGQGVVLSTGPELVIDGKVIPPPVAVGDRVIYKKWGGGDDVKYHGTEYKLVKFEDLMAVLED